MRAMWCFSWAGSTRWFSLNAPALLSHQAAPLRVLTVKQVRGRVAAAGEAQSCGRDGARVHNRLYDGTTKHASSRRNNSPDPSLPSQPHPLSHRMVLSLVISVLSSVISRCWQLLMILPAMISVLIIACDVFPVLAMLCESCKRAQT